MIIRAYGIFWERDLVNFGKKGKGNLGSLQGHFDKATTASELKDQRGIYVLYEGSNIAQQRVVYVGQTGSGSKRLLSRLRDHTNNHLWNRWQRFSWFGFLEMGPNQPKHINKGAVGNIPVATALDIVEAALIVTLEPIRNKQGPQWHGAVEYFQGNP